MPRKSQANLKAVELVDQIQIESLADRETLAKKTRMWVKAWISDQLDPLPNSRVSYTVHLKPSEDNRFPVGCYVQVYSIEGFFQAYQVGKDARRAVKNSLNQISNRINEVNAPQRLVSLPRGLMEQEAS